MKRALLFMLSCCLICSFSGCGDGKADSGTVSGSSRTETSATATTPVTEEEITDMIAEPLLTEEENCCRFSYI